MISQKRLGLLFVLVGPGGAGKNELMRAVLERAADLRQMPTATTRKRRDGEVEGQHHLFVSVAEFQRMIAHHELVEWQEVHKDTFYGVPRARAEQVLHVEYDLIADIDVHGASVLRSIYPDNTVLIFIQPPGSTDDQIIATLRERMENRKSSTDDIEERLARVRMELPHAANCDYLIINDEFEQAVQVLFGIILAERSRRALYNLRAARHLPRHRFAYAALVTPLCGYRVLRRAGDGSPLTGRLLHGEFPHEAALRLLREALEIDVQVANLVSERIEDGGFVSPLAVQSSDETHFEQVTFEYVYQLDDTFTAPPGWEWVARDEHLLELTGAPQAQE